MRDYTVFIIKIFKVIWFKELHPSFNTASKLYDCIGCGTRRSIVFNILFQVFSHDIITNTLAIKSTEHSMLPNTQITTLEKKI